MRRRLVQANGPSSTAAASRLDGSVAVAIAIRGVGALLAFTLLVAPGAAALSVVGSLRAAFVLATVIGVVATVVGIAGSYWLDLPTGPTIVGILAVVFGLSYLWAATRRA